jgi:hypothetical protein
MADQRVSVADRLAEAKIALDNAMASETILGYLSEYGYDQTRLAQGRALYERAAQWVLTQGDELGDQKNATESRDLAREHAHAEYMKFVKLARKVITKSGDRARLQLDGQRPIAFNDWAAQVGVFYTRALADPDILRALAEFNITPAKLQAGKALLDTVVAAHETQVLHVGERQDSTAERDRALAELAAWLSKYRVAAEVALDDHPQLLESLGWLVRNEPPAGQPSPAPEPTP